MKRTINISLGAAALTCVLSSVALADDRDGINGFGSYEFGLTVDQVKNLTALEPIEAESGSPTVYRALEPVMISDLAYRIELEFKSGRLIKINLTQNEPNVLRMHCDLTYGLTADRVASTYGSWNTSEKDIKFFGAQIKAQRRNFPDRSAVVVNQLHNIEPNDFAGPCMIGVVYLPPDEGATF